MVWGVVKVRSISKFDQKMRLRVGVTNLPLGRRLEDGKAFGPSFLCDFWRFWYLGLPSWGSTFSLVPPPWHFLDPLSALREWDRVLRPGGALLLLLPWAADGGTWYDEHKEPATMQELLHLAAVNASFNRLVSGKSIWTNTHSAHALYMVAWSWHFSLTYGCVSRGVHVQACCELVH